PPESDSQSESYCAPSREPEKRQKSLDSNSYGSGIKSSWWATAHREIQILQKLSTPIAPPAQLRSNPAESSEYHHLPPFLRARVDMWLQPDPSLSRPNLSNPV